MLYNMRKNSIKTVFIALLLAAANSSCSLVEVNNPNITDEKFLGSPQSAAIWLNGIKKQLGSTLNQTVVFSEIVSDNYFNNSSLTNKVFDRPTLRAVDLDIDQLQRQISKLREMSVYGIESVVPATDEANKQDILAQMYFYGAYAHILTGELMAHFPLESNGEVVPASVHFNKAIENLIQAQNLDSDVERKNTYALALARAYYYLGDGAQASQYALQAKQADPLLLFNAYFDGLNGSSNTMQSYTFSSSTNTLAPLPRLDFLDPKYYHVGNINADQKPIALLKIEEAYLIMAEAALGTNQLSEAKGHLSALITDVIEKRPKATVNARHSVRKGSRADYPLSGNAKVRASAEAPYRSGLVLPRTEQDIEIFTVSGTSVQVEDIENAQTRDELLYILCLMRQEIFMSEGRRMTDLGIRFPISNIEKQNNPAVQPSHLEPIIPSFIPMNSELDNFTYDAEADLVTIQHDMNQVLVQNKTHEYVLPLIKN